MLQINLINNQLVLELTPALQDKCPIYFNEQQVGEIKREANDLELYFYPNFRADLIVTGCVQANFFTIHATRVSLVISISLNAAMAHIFANKCIIDQQITINKIGFNIRTSLEINASLHAASISINSLSEVSFNQRIFAEELNVMAALKIAVNEKLVCSRHCVLEAKNIEIIEDTISKQSKLYGNVIKKLRKQPIYYIYVPIEKHKVSQDILDMGACWKGYEEENVRHVKIFYYRDKEVNFAPCLANIPDYAKIYVLMHGTDLLPLSTFASVTPATLLKHKSTRKHLTLVSGSNYIPIDEIAGRMVTDGLFSNNNSHLRIKLFNCDPVGKAPILGGLLLEELKDQQRNYTNNKVCLRVDYYYKHNLFPCHKLEEADSPHKYAELPRQANHKVRASHVRFSLYSREHLHPQFSLEDFNHILGLYDQYLAENKFLFFKKDPQKNPYVQLLMQAKNDHERYLRGLHCIRENSDDVFVRIMRQTVIDIKHNEQQLWKGLVKDHISRPA